MAEAADAEAEAEAEDIMEANFGDAFVTMCVGARGAWNPQGE